MSDEFSTLKPSPQLVSQIIDALKNKAYGSIEIYIENYHVAQITERTITKVGIRQQKNFSYKNNQRVQTKVA